MITTAQIDNILQNIYLDVIGTQIDRTTSPFFNMIEKSTQNISQGTARFPARMGISGSVACGTETGAFPVADDVRILNFEVELCNIYGTMQITDKALRCSNNTPSDAINLFQNELESLVNSAKYNFNRMLMGNGSGILCYFDLNNKMVFADSVHKLAAGMVVDVYDPTHNLLINGATIMGIDLNTKAVELNKKFGVERIEDGYMCVQGSKNNEMLGIEYIFDVVDDYIYKVSKNDYPFFNPLVTSANDVNCDAMQSAIDMIEEKSGTIIDFIACSYEIRRKYLAALANTRTNIDYMNLDGGFKALSYNGIPVYADKFADTTSMYFLNTKDFVLAQLGDWDWITGVDGHILIPSEDTPDYVAHLAKYANLVCKRPYAQGKIIF